MTKMLFGSLDRLDDELPSWRWTIRSSDKSAVRRQAGLGLLSALLSVGLAVQPVKADPGAAQVCPPREFKNTFNLAPNPSLETVGPLGPSTLCHACNTPSAAKGWLVHSNGPPGAAVGTQLVPTTVPTGTDPSGLDRMLNVRAGAQEGGIYVNLRVPRKLMFSAWVNVAFGHVVLGANGHDTTHPASWSTKHNQWEVLRVCTDGTQTNGTPFFIYNEDPAGGSFAVDRLEIREIP